MKMVDTIQQKDGKIFVLCSKCNKKIEPNTRVIVGQQGAIYHVSCGYDKKRGSIGYV